MERLLLRGKRRRLLDCRGLLDWRAVIRLLRRVIRLRRLRRMVIRLLGVRLWRVGLLVHHHVGRITVGVTPGRWRRIHRVP